jgi:[protein-PII] uridylyltransferase
LKRPFVSERERRTKTLSESSVSSQELVEDFLESRESLIQQDLKEDSGPRITRKYTGLMDRFIRSLFLQAGFGGKLKEIKEERIVLVALGSYGRRELCLGSDIDLMVIYRGSFSPQMKQVILRGLYPLWDANLDVGYNILTIQECIRLAMEDFRALTSVMDARFLLGSRVFHRQFEEAFWSRIDREKGTLLKQFLIAKQKREEKYESQSYFVEPDIKESLGGLRDLHFMAWMARIYLKSKSLSQIKRFPAFSHFGLDKLGYSKGFLLKIRNHLHHLAGGRKQDLLLLSFQKEISNSLGYEDGTSETGPERFMRGLYLHLNRIRYGSEEFYVKVLDIIDPRPLEPAPYRLPQELQVTKGNIVLKGEGLLQRNPLLILKAFSEANRQGLFLGSGLIWAGGKTIAAEGEKLLSLPEAKGLFLDIILKPRNPKILRLALNMGLIGLFIPEFKKIKNLAQFDYYHMETVDLHSVKTLEVIHEISTGAYDDRWPLFREIYRELENPDLLFLAGLLHDMGKGYPGDHAERGAQLIPRILGRLDMNGGASQVVSFLVRYHLLLVRVSQRRDLHDEKTSVQVAQTIQNLETLKLLFLLAVADSISTGPLAHSDWKTMLVIELFFKVKRILEGGRLASPDATKRLEDNRRALSERLAPEFRSGDIRDLMDQVSTRYFLSNPLADMAEHFRLGLTMGKEKLAWTLQKLKDAPVTRVILCTYDKPGLFSKMVGVYTLNNIKVLSANIFTLKNGLAFDVYEVTNPLDPYREERMWNKIHAEALQAIEDQIPLDELISKKERQLFSLGDEYGNQPKKVKIDNVASDFFTIVEVSAWDRIGLLYELAKEVFSLGLDIRFAKVNADKERMTGVFYVRDSGGQKILEEDEIQRIKREIMNLME